MLSFRLIFLLHIVINVPVTLSQEQGIPTDTSESRVLLESDYDHVNIPLLMNSLPSAPLELLKPDIGSNSTNQIAKPAVSVQQNRSPVPGSSNCFVDNIIQGFGYDANVLENGSYSIPPDPSGAAGMQRLVSVVNRMIEVRSKNGALIFRDGLADFFTSLGTTQSSSIRVFDPKVVYDEHEGRFVVVTIQRVDSPNLSRILMAVSKNELPDSSSEWNFLSIDSLLNIGGNLTWADYPGFEVDEAAVYVTANMFTFISDNYGGVRLWIVDKGVSGGFYGGGTSPIIRGPYNPYQQSGFATTTMPAQVHGSGGIVGSIGTFLVSGYRATSTTDFYLQVVTIMNPLNTPTFTISLVNLGTITQNVLPGAPQFGTSTLIDAGERRILDAVWRGNKLWVTLTINPPTGFTDANQATAHWVRLDTTNGIVTLEDQGNIGGESFSLGTHTYYPAVAVNKQGLAAFGYSASSPTLYGGAYGSILLGSMLYSFTVQDGKDSYLRKFAGNRNRWGDYSGISVDPSDDSFWIFNQYADIRGTFSSMYNEDGRWGTVWAKVYCGTLQPTSAPINVPTIVLPPVPTPTNILPPVPTPTNILPPVPTPTNVSPTPPTPSNISCGLFGLSIFCPFTWCGIFGRLLGICLLE